MQRTDKQLSTNEIITRFGQPGDNQVYVDLPYPMILAWDRKVSINRFQAHKEFKPVLQDILKDTLEHYGLDKIKELGLNEFGGCLNIRKMRGGSLLSVHSWGLALDLDPLNNQLKWGKDKARFAKPEYDRFWKIVERHGCYSLGRIKNYDWMHFQLIPVG